MKCITLITAVILVCIGTTSCQKKYTCTCVYPYAAAGTTTTTIKAYKRSDAQATCTSMNTGAKLSGGACAL